MSGAPFGYVYEILFPNGKRYVGQTTNLDTRLSRYRKYQCKGQPFLYYALLKYKWENVKFSLICECSSQEELNEREIYFIAYHKCQEKDFGYNIQEGGKNCKHTKESREKMSKSQRGRKLSEEQKARRKELMKKYKYTHTEESKRLMSIASKARCGANWNARKTPEGMKAFKEKTGGKNHVFYGKKGKDCHSFGLKRSEETKKKMSEWQIDKRIRKFYNSETGVEFFGTRQQFKEKFSIKKDTLIDIVTRNKIRKGWTCLKEEDFIKKKESKKINV